MKAISAIPRAKQILRSVMVAGAGTAIWMALSATTASADPGTPDGGALLGDVKSSVTSTVSSVTSELSDATTKATRTTVATTKAVSKVSTSVSKAASPKSAGTAVTVPLPSVPLPEAVKAVVQAQQVKVPVPAVTPVVTQVAASADDGVASVPVVSRILPADSVSDVVDAAVVPITGAVDAKVDTAVPPVNNVLAPVALAPVTEVVNPVVQPVVDVVDSVLPPALGSIPPGGPLPPVGGLLPPLTDPGTSAPPASGGGPEVQPATPNVAAQLPPVVGTAGDGTQAATVTAVDEPAKANVAPTTGTMAMLLRAWFGDQSTIADNGQPGAGPAADGEQPTPLPGGQQEGPLGAAGAGSGSSNNGTSGAAAAFLQHALIIPADALTGVAIASNEHHPKPVSFDPGSSPD